MQQSAPVYWIWWIATRRAKGKQAACWAIPRVQSLHPPKWGNTFFCFKHSCSIKQGKQKKTQKKDKLYARFAPICKPRYELEPKIQVQTTECLKMTISFFKVKSVRGKSRSLKVNIIQVTLNFKVNRPNFDIIRKGINKNAWWKFCDSGQVCDEPM